MRLLLCTQAVDRNDPNLGFFHRWIEEFAKHCESVTVVCLQKGDYSFPPHVTVHSLGKERGGVSRLRYAFRFWKLLLQHHRSYDAVFVHMNPEYLILGGLWWRLTARRVGLWYVHKSVNWRLRVAIFFSNIVFTATPESFRLKTRKVLVTGHGIDLGRSVPPRIMEPGVVRLITVGRISPSKHVEVLVDAYGLLKEKLSTTLKIIGGPVGQHGVSYEKQLRIQLEHLGEDPKKILLGALPHEQLPQVRAQADYFIHASETGSADKSLLDAIMSGLIPCTSSEAYKEILYGYEEELMYKRGDAETLARCIEKLASLSESERDDMVHTLKERVSKKHSLQNLIPTLLAAL